MGAYGTIKPGSSMEVMAIQGLKDIQKEEILKIKLLVQASIGSEQNELNKLFKEFIASASPFIEYEIKKKDQKMTSLLKQEVAKGSFGITPLQMPDDNITLRATPRKRKFKNKL